MTNSPTAINHVVARLHETFRRYPGAFRSALEVLGSAPLGPIEYSKAILRKPDHAATHYSGFLAELSRQPVDTELGIAVNALQHAMATFAIRDCRVPTREEVLVGLFRGSIATSLNAFNEAARTRGDEREEPRLFTVDLNVKGREGRTGGDIAFIFDIEHPVGGRLIVPLCLQAKRASPAEGETVSIRRFNKSDEDGDHQLKRLDKFNNAGCNCAYIFFDNDQDFVVDEPVLPLLKSTDDIRSDTSELDVDLSSNTIDFASYVHYLVAHGINAVGKMSELQATITTLAEGKVSHLVLISSDIDAWEHVLSMMGPGRAGYFEPARYSVGLVDFGQAFADDNSYARGVTTASYTYTK